MNGMQMLLGQLGIDPKKITQDFTELKEGVQATLGNISSRLEAIQKQQEIILHLVQELTAWKRVQTHQPLLNQPALQPAVQPAPNPALVLQPEQPQQQQ